MSNSEGGWGGVGFLDVLNILSFMIGLENLSLNQQQMDGIMSEMQDSQNKMLEKIIKQNEEIISLLKENNNVGSDIIGNKRADD